MHKYIVTHTSQDGTQFSNAYIIPNHYSHSLDSFQKLLDEAKKSFKYLKPEHVECRTVIQSQWCKNHPILKFPCPTNAKRKGWENREKLSDITYS